MSVERILIRLFAPTIVVGSLLMPTLAHAAVTDPHVGDAAVHSSVTHVLVSSEAVTDPHVQD